MSKINVEPQTGFALVELFTSEGCSSCPAAEKAVEELANQYPDNVYVLSFHVDYWNRLGWTDPFSKPQYTARQNDYATQFNLGSLYTPQVVINGNHEFVGSDKRKLQSVTANEFKNAPVRKLELLVEQNGSKAILVKYTAEPTNDEQLHIALVQNQATTNVKRGENGARKLHHINVVLDYKTVALPKGAVELALPLTLPIGNTKVIAYLQNRNGLITAVKKMNVAGV